MRFTSYLPPSVNSYLGKRVAFANGKPYVHIYETKEAKDYKTYMKKVLNRAVLTSGWVKPDEFTYIECKMTVFLSQKRRDSDNLQKCLLDSLTENNVIYDDSMIIPRVENIFIDKENPRIEVELIISEKKGVFDNEEKYLNFKNKNCIRCKRLNRNCSILKKSIENKLTKEVDVEKNVCIKV